MEDSSTSTTANSDNNNFIMAIIISHDVLRSSLVRRTVAKIGTKLRTKKCVCRLVPEAEVELQ